jgi:hypothetical protein
MNDGGWLPPEQRLRLLARVDAVALNFGLAVAKCQQLPSLAKDCDSQY